MNKIPLVRLYGDILSVNDNVNPSMCKRSKALHLLDLLASAFLHSNRVELTQCGRK